jgi:hypothetical protein
VQYGAIHNHELQPRNKTLALYLVDSVLNMPGMKSTRFRRFHLATLKDAVPVWSAEVLMVNTSEFICFFCSANGNRLQNSWKLSQALCRILAATTAF